MAAPPAPADLTVLDSGFHIIKDLEIASSVLPTLPIGETAMAPPPVSVDPVQVQLSPSTMDAPATPLPLRASTRKRHC